MQEQVKETGRSTAGVKKEAKAVKEGRARAWLRLFGEQLLFGGAGYVLGHAELLFGTFPLGMAFLCASRGHTVAILLGLLVSALFRMQSPLVYLCAYCAAALLRGVIGLLWEEGEQDAAVGREIREKLRASRAALREIGEESGERTGKKSLLARLYAGLERTAAWKIGRRLAREMQSVLCRSLLLRLGISVAASLLILLWRVIDGGFQYYDLFAALFGAFVTPAAVILYAIALDGRTKDRILLALSWGTLLFSAVFAAERLLLLGFSFAAVLALYLTLHVSARRGVWLGAGAGLLVGIAYEPLYAPAFLLAALAYALVGRREHPQGGVLTAIGAFLSWGIYAGGVSALPQLLPPLLLGGSAFTLVERLRDRQKRDAEEGEEQEKKRERAEEGMLSETRCRDANERFRGISDAFSSLSEMFYTLSDRFRRPGALDLRRICDNAFDTHCADCPNKTVCWGLEYPATLSTVNTLISRLHTRGRVSLDEIPESLRRRCSSAEQILDTVNRDCATLTGEMLRNNRTEIFAMDYEAAASIINDALEEDDGEYRFDEALERRIAEYLRDAGVGFSSVTVYGNRRRQILIRGADTAASKVTEQVLRADLGEMCGLELGRPSLELEEGVQTLILRAQKRIAVLGAENNVSADGGVSGDSVNLFSSKRDYFYALISDGMGAGREAAFTSGLCSVFLEKMLRAGNRAWTSLRMLNNMIRSRGANSLCECSSTVDLLELDLMTGEASFIKSGAAPSFVVRRGEVHRLEAGTAPIGIIEALDAKATDFPLRIGDTVVLVSDGVLPEDDDGRWLEEMLSACGEMTPEEIVYRICLHAASREGHDDCSAIALRIMGAVEG
ncbi:MAG: SpoIIE family protein phosphatase [Clostridia bacterium]|nr:SpoIIE family protein phosphatase [Clostridia bacterium]